MTLALLIERLEKATGPDRELDGAIAVAMFKTVATDDDLIYARRRDPSGEDATHPGHYFIKSRSGAQAVSAPAFTSSIDAALTLVPEGHTWAGGDLSEENTPWCCVTSNESSKDFTALFAWSVPIAICIAALRAREVQS